MTARDTSTRPSVTLSDPFARVLALDEFDQRRFFVGLAASVVLYAALAIQAFVFYTELHDFASSVSRALTKPKPTEYEVEPPPPPPPEPAPPPEPEPPPEPVKAAPPPKAAPPDAPPPAAAQAGKVLTAEPDPNEPVDLTQDGFVQGTSDAFAGGVTTSNGTSRTAVRDVRATGSAEPIAVAVKPTGTKTDLSRDATPLSGSWDHCGFPAEADMEQVNSALVVIAVKISADGVADSCNVMSDPGYGFGALAKRCALRERFSPALSKEGTAVATTKIIRMNFRR